jgi:hypothetical protein
MTSPTLDHTDSGDTGNARIVVAIAWPTGRPIYAYTAKELADGVDVYTKAMKARVTGVDDCEAGDA